MDIVNREKIEYLITKRGVPVARLIPVEERSISPFGYMKDTVVFMKDIVKPIDVEWNVTDT